ncbi:MAG: glycoside hydrolase family 3 N-terminal domain-containing protein [Pseudomonadota bacterium]
MGHPKAAIFGLAGPELTPHEAAFFGEADPWGFILFARNVVDPDQVRGLTAALRESVGRDAPILVDQEGGRVQRLRPPHWREWAPVRDLGEDGSDEMSILTALRQRYADIAQELLAVGIDVNCVPVLDVPQPNAHPIIGNRALGRTASEIAIRGREAMAGLLDHGVLPVIKHIPGHGRSLHDSHENLPRVPAELHELRSTDFPPFLSLRDAPLGMTAHIVYEAIDPENCATQSPDVISLIRSELGFDGLLMTDDLSMKALSGTMAQRAERSLNAGCDVVLHCNGDMTEMAGVASRVPGLAGAALERADRADALRFSKRSSVASGRAAEIHELGVAHG